jgi:hypothetical protein
MCLESKNKNAGESAVIWHEKTGAVQPKVDRANMLIQVRFFKVCRGLKQGIFWQAGSAPNDAVFDLCRRAHRDGIDNRINRMSAS